jgi:hypothetical protein
VVFRFPETLDYQHLVQIQRPRADLPESMIGPDASCAAATASRSPTAATRPRENLSEIHYCVLCHERDKDSCSKGLQRQGRRDHEQPARHPARRLPARREDLRDAHAAEGGRRDRSAGASSSWTTRCAGHRPPHLQRLHEGLHLPEAGAGQHPADRDGRAHRRAEDAVRRGDLRPADALESAQRPPSVRAALQRPQHPRRWAWARPATRWRTTCSTRASASWPSTA